MQTSRTFRSHFKNPKATRANVRSSAGYGIGSAKMALKNFISGYIESPLIPGYKVYIALFTQQEKSSDILYDVAWSAPRREQRQDVPPAPDMADVAQYVDDGVIPF